MEFNALANYAQAPAFATTLKKMNLKPVAVILIIALILNLTLFAFRAISQLLFWAVIIAIAVAYKVMPELKPK